MKTFYQVVVFLLIGSSVTLFALEEKPRKEDSNRAGAPSEQCREEYSAIEFDRIVRQEAQSLGSSGRGRRYNTPKEISVFPNLMAWEMTVKKHPKISRICVTETERPNQFGIHVERTYKALVEEDAEVLIYLIGYRIRK